MKSPYCSVFKKIHNKSCIIPGCTGRIKVDVIGSLMCLFIIKNCLICNNGLTLTKEINDLLIEGKTQEEILNYYYPDEINT
jgi:hypothetical protein